MNKVTTIQLVLLAGGAFGFTMVGGVLKDRGSLDHEPNVLTLKGSPFGRTLALAMRGPVDVYWHRGQVHEHGHDDDGHGHGHGHGHDHEDDHDHEDHHDDDYGGAVPVSSGSDHDDHDDHDHDHEEREIPEELAKHFDALDLEVDDHHHDDERPPLEFNGEIRPFLLDVIDHMRTAYYGRSNPNPDTALHKAFIMAETERRLALSYQMDPTNNACYGSYFLFLSEAMVRVAGRSDEQTRISAGQQRAMDLCNFTIQYCLQHQDEAPAMITAATAAHDYLQIYLSTQDPDPQHAAPFLQVMGQTLGRYEAIRAQMIEDGTWANFGVHRINELEGAHDLVVALSKSDLEVYQRLVDAKKNEG